MFWQGPITTITTASKMDHLISGGFVLFTGASTNERTGSSLLALCGHLCWYTLVYHSGFGDFSQLGSSYFFSHVLYVEHASRWFYAPAQRHLTNYQKERHHCP